MKGDVASLAVSIWLGLLGGVLADGTTAAGALSALGRDRGEAFRSNVLQVIGVGGVDQPPVWRVLTRDPFQVGAIRDFAIEKGRVVGDQFVPPVYHSRIPTEVLREDKLRVDSSHVFAIADARARSAKVGFYSLDYEVRSGSDQGGGIWIVRLNGADRGGVGELVLSAIDGRILRERWRQAEVVSEPGSGGGDVGGESVANQISEGWKRAKSGLVQGKELVKKNAEEAGNSVKVFLRDVLERGGDAEGGGARSGASVGYGYQGTNGERAAALDAGRYH